ncbi:hypothetical protein JZ968_11420 [Riemerella anatipestifer]
MERLNYFNPYKSKNSNHEDQLTRAFLVLLKHSIHAFSAFLSYVNKKNENSQKFDFIDFIEEGWNFETQKGNPFIETNLLASILITDNQIIDIHQVQVSERNARYDGIITFGSKLTFVIENKPRSQNVWFDQLNPSRSNLSEETEIITSPIQLEWKVIIRHLNLIKSLETINGFERIMIEDFLDFIDKTFPYLNPFDTFKVCKSNSELLYRRINNILKEIVNDENIVEYHRGWGYYIKTPYNGIKKIGLILGEKENDWWLELSLYFGDTQSQAKAFYNSNPNLDSLNDDWYYFPNFHLSFVTSNLVWFSTNKEYHEKYIDFWKCNISKIFQHPKNQVQSLIDNLVSENIIVVDDKKSNELNEKFFQTNMQTINVCPGFGIITEMSSTFCEEQDQSDKLKYYIAKQIQNGLKTVNYNSEEILKKKYCR